MGEPARPQLAERAKTRTLAKAIVDSVRNDEAMPLPAELTQRHAQDESLEDFAFQLAQEIDLLFNDEMAFIAHAAMTAMQTAVPYEAKQQLLHEILSATRCRLPDWWPDFKKEQKPGG